MIDLEHQAFELLRRALPFLQGRTTEDSLEKLIQDIFDLLGDYAEQ